MLSQDQETVAGFLRGDRRAVHRIQGWLEQAAGRYARKLATPWEDVRQELLLEITGLLRRGGFRGDAQLRTFLWRVVHYKCLNMLRDQRRRDSGCHVLEEEPDTLPTAGGSPLELVLDEESAAVLLRFLSATPPACRRLWTMILAGKSYREMARELGVSEGALRVRVLRCRRKALALWENSASADS